MNPLALVGGPYALLIKWAIISSLVLGFGGACAYKMHEHDQIELEQVKADFNVFRGGVAALGKAAQDRAKAQNALNQQNTENANAAHKLEVAARDRTIAGLRSARAQRGASGGFVPGPGGTTGSPAVVRFNGSILDGALRTLDQGVQGLVDEGSLAVIDLNAGKRFAQGLKLARSLETAP